MKYIKRKIVADSNYSEISEFCKSEFYKSQASLNSDGRIVLRNYASAQNDEIICLSKNETEAIFALMQQINCLTNRHLPF